MSASKAIVTPNQLQMLKILDLYGEDGLSRSELAERAKVACTQTALGPSYVETLGSWPESLWAQGYVTANDQLVDNKRITIFYITEEGREVLGSLKTKRYSTFRGRVSPRVLNPIVIEYSKNLTYGHDKYGDKDLNIIRGLLPEKYHHINNEDLKSQIIAQRKCGAYKKELPLFPDWVGEYRQTPEFLDKQRECLDRWNGECAINDKHTEGVLAYHRRLMIRAETELEERTIIDNERVDLNDLIPLCIDCARRVRVSLVKFTEEHP